MVDNIVVKGENTGHQHLLLLQQYFLKPSFHGKDFSEDFSW